MSFAAPTRERSGPVLPMASMVDILFLLLIFFMIAGVFREEEKQIDVSLPGQATASVPAPATQTFITITADGLIHVGDRTLSLPELRTVLEQVVRLSPGESVVIRGDRASRLELTVKVIDAARAAGVRDVRIGTTKAASDL